MLLQRGAWMLLQRHAWMLLQLHELQLPGVAASLRCRHASGDTCHNISAVKVHSAAAAAAVGLLPQTLLQDSLQSRDAGHYITLHFITLLFLWFASPARVDSWCHR
jgi:hypothetical protein